VAKRGEPGPAWCLCRRIWNRKHKCQIIN